MTVLVMTLGLAACDNNDENSPVIPPAQITTDVVFGDYAGQMFTSLVEKEEGTAGTEVSAAVNNRTDVHFFGGKRGGNCRYRGFSCSE